MCNKLPTLAEATIHEFMEAEALPKENCEGVISKIRATDENVTGLMSWCELHGVSARCAVCILYRILQMQLQRDDTERLLSDVKMGGEGGIPGPDG